ncbi:MAG: YggT family protein [Candidatus Ancaeobacter aquaticus]|nr:YggT family protein [Candidatus Ancaeobacter aquaticus]
MFVIGNLFSALATIVDIVLTILYWLILIRTLISWVNPDPYNVIVQYLNKLTEPILRPIRRLIPMSIGIDISPIIAFLAIILVKSFLVKTLMDLSTRLQ